MLDSTSSGLHDLPRHLKMPSQRIVVCESVTTSPGAVRPLMLHHGFGQRSTDWLTDGPCRSSTLLQSWISSMCRRRPTGVYSLGGDFGFGLAVYAPHRISALICGGASAHASNASCCSADSTNLDEAMP